MNSNRKTAIIVGILFILGFAGVFSPVFVKPILDDPNYLVKIAENTGQVTLGAFFELIMAFACAGIAIGLYPILRKHNEFLALGAVGFRLIENIFQIVAALCLLVLLAVSQAFAQSGASSASNYQALGALLLAVRFWAPLVLAQIGFGLGAWMYYYVFYQSKLIPRWLSGWGLIAITLQFALAFLIMFLRIDPFSGSPILLMSVPIFFQELTLAAWLIFKGFDPSAVASLSDPTATKALLSAA
jgi:hypothetical protein